MHLTRNTRRAIEHFPATITPSEQRAAWLTVRLANPYRLNRFQVLEIIAVLTQILAESEAQTETVSPPICRPWWHFTNRKAH